MAAETGQGYLSRVVRSGARPFFASARRAADARHAAAQRAETPEVARAAAEPSQTFDAHDRGAQPGPPASLTRPAPPELSASTTSASFDGAAAFARDTETTRGSATTPGRSPDASASSGAPSGPVEGEGAGLVQTPEGAGATASAPSHGGDAAADFGDAFDAGVVDAGEIRPALEARGAVESSGEPEREAEYDAEYKASVSPWAPRPDAQASPSSAPQERAPASADAHGESFARADLHASESGPTPRGEDSRRDVARASRGDASRTGVPTPAPAALQGEGVVSLQHEEPTPREATALRGGETVTRRHDDAASDARTGAGATAPFLQHGRGETIVRLPRLSGAARPEQKSVDATVERTVVDDPGANASAAGGVGRESDVDEASKSLSNTNALSTSNHPETSGPRPDAAPSLRTGAGSRAPETHRNVTPAAAPKSHQSAGGKGAAQGEQGAAQVESARSARPPATTATTTPPAPSSRALSPGASVGAPARASASHTRAPAHATTSDTHARASDTHAPTPAAASRADASVVAQSRAGSPQREGGDARRAAAGETAELLPAESKRPRVGETRPAREPSPGGAPTVTVKRLDVRVVEQAPPAPPPAPARPAPAPQRDGWESLDRGHLGRLFLL